MQRCQWFAQVAQIGTDLLYRERLDDHRRMQHEPLVCGCPVILTSPTTDHKRMQVFSMIGVDGRDTVRACGLLHFVQTIKEWKDSFCSYPLLAQATRDMIE